MAKCFGYVDQYCRGCRCRNHALLGAVDFRPARASGVPDIPPEPIRHLVSPTSPGTHSVRSPRRLSCGGSRCRLGGTGGAWRSRRRTSEDLRLSISPDVSQTPTPGSPYTSGGSSLALASRRGEVSLRKCRDCRCQLPHTSGGISGSAPRCRSAAADAQYCCWRSGRR